MANKPNQNTVMIVKNGLGENITMFHNNGFGFITLSTERTICGQVETIYHRHKGSVSILEQIVSTDFINGSTCGTIIIKEFLESQVPKSLQDEHYGKVPYKSTIEAFVKKDLLTGETIIIDGERVMRITEFVKMPNSIVFTALTVEYILPK